MLYLRNSVDMPHSAQITVIPRSLLPGAAGAVVGTLRFFRVELPGGGPQIFDRELLTQRINLPSGRSGVFEWNRFGFDTIYARFDPAPGSADVSLRVVLSLQTGESRQVETETDFLCQRDIPLRPGLTYLLKEAESSTFTVTLKRMVGSITRFVFNRFYANGFPSLDSLYHPVPAIFTSSKLTSPCSEGQMSYLLTLRGFSGSDPGGDPPTRPPTATATWTFTPTFTPTATFTPTFTPTVTPSPTPNTNRPPPPPPPNPENTPTPTATVTPTRAPNGGGCSRSNTPPSLDFTSSRYTVEAGKELIIYGAASDPDPHDSNYPGLYARFDLPGSTVNNPKLQHPSGAAIPQSVPFIMIKFKNQVAGTYSFTVMVEDSCGALAKREFTVTVTNGPPPPSGQFGLSFKRPVETAYAGLPWSARILVNRIVDRWDVRVTNNLGFINLFYNRGQGEAVLSYNFDRTHSGKTYTVSVTAFAGSEIAKASYTFTVMRLDRNYPPTFINGWPSLATINREFSFEVQAKDPNLAGPRRPHEDLYLTLRFNGQSYGATLARLERQSDGVFRWLFKWTPRMLGQHFFELVVTDNEGASTTKSFNIFVRPNS